MDNHEYIVLWYAPNGSVDGSSFLTNFAPYKAKGDAIRFADTVNGIVIKTDFFYQGDKTNPYVHKRLKKRCPQCVLENNTGICNRNDCSNYINP